jgi:heme/copper-type cytochrome/quinol oxidase subunit 2
VSWGTAAMVAAGSPLHRQNRVWVPLLIIMLVVAFAVLVWLIASFVRHRMGKREDR